MVPRKKNLSVIVVVLLALLLIALVILIYDKKMQETSKRMHQSSVKQGSKSGNITVGKALISKLKQQNVFTNSYGY